MSEKDRANATRTAIIQAAGELFATSGFNGVTARQIASQAGVSLSTIPYHFGTMETLYKEVLLAACETSAEARAIAERARSARPSEGLRFAVRFVLEHYATEAAPWPVQLVGREILDPTPEFLEIVERKFSPEFSWMCEIVGRAARRPADADAVGFGVVALCALAETMMNYRQIMEVIAPSVLSTAKEKDEFVDIVAKITLDAVRRYATVFENREGE